MTRFYFIRHGENIDHAEGIFGSTRDDDALTETGREQAHKVAHHVATLSITHLVSSDLPRAIETAAIIAEHIDITPTVDPRFREVEVGGLSGARANDDTWKRWNRVIDAWAEGKIKTQFPGGENYMDLWGRMKAAIVELAEAHPNGTIAVVMHGGIMRATLKDLCPGGNVEWYRRFPIDNGAIIAVDIGWKENRIQGRMLHGELVHWAETAHLA